jgi:hypothetical protein
MKITLTIFFKQVQSTEYNSFEDEDFYEYEYCGNSERKLQSEAAKIGKEVYLILCLCGDFNYSAKLTYYVYFVFVFNVHVFWFFLLHNLNNSSLFNEFMCKCLYRVFENC